jgi:hypothetical protein
MAVHLVAKRCSRLPLRFAPALAALALAASSTWAQSPDEAPAQPAADRTAPAEAAADEPAPPATRVLVVVGAPGSDEYDEMFRNWAAAWRVAAQAGEADFTLIGAEETAEPPVDEAVEPTASDETSESAEDDAEAEEELKVESPVAATQPATPAAESPAAAATDETAAEAGESAAVAPAADDPADAERLQQFLADHATRSNAEPLWIVLIGHGTFDGAEAKFNLRGPDVAAKQFAEWLAPIKTPVALVNCASASAPFINAASGPGRVVIAATKSGFEQNFARFGKYLAAAVVDDAADLDKDGQTSLLEAYLTACRGVAEFYSGDQRLATEHALLDDNGDGLGTPADWFRGVRATQRAKEGASLDGLRAHQLHLVRSDRETGMPREVRDRRDALEMQLAALRDKKTELGDEAYYAQLKPLLVELAELYASAGPETTPQ